MLVFKIFFSVRVLLPPKKTLPTHKPAVVGGCIVVGAVGSPVGVGTPPEAVDRHPVAADKPLDRMVGTRPGVVGMRLGVVDTHLGEVDTPLGHNPKDSNNKRLALLSNKKMMYHTVNL